jgi:predicted heme/steroid binding protein
MSYAIEVKHTGGREPIETIIERYQPQLQWIMFVTNTKQAALSVIMGANQPIVEYIERDDDYIAEMVKRATAFMECVRTKTIPVDIAEPVPAPVPGKVYDMSSSNSWSSEAYLWRENIAGKRLAEMAEKSLKALVPPDAKKCHGAGIYISRDRVGRLSLREISDE